MPVVEEEKKKRTRGSRGGKTNSDVNLSEIANELWKILQMEDSDAILRTKSKTKKPGTAATLAKVKSTRKKLSNSTPLPLPPRWLKTAMPKETEVLSSNEGIIGENNWTFASRKLTRSVAAVSDSETGNGTWEMLRAKGPDFFQQSKSNKKKPARSKKLAKKKDKTMNDGRTSEGTIEENDCTFSAGLKGKLKVKRSLENSVMNGKKKVKYESGEFTENEYRQFPKYLPKAKVKEILGSWTSESKNYAKGPIRINPRNPSQAFVSCEQALDILVSGVRNRNRAMDGDIVLVLPDSQCPSDDSCEGAKTGEVVAILEKIHPRKIVGKLKKMRDNFVLVSRDCKLPQLVIDPSSLPSEDKLTARFRTETLFLASIVDWPFPNFCKGRVEKIMGRVGDLEGETNAILFSNGLDVSPYEDLPDLPSGPPSELDLEGREDWRDKCVFTIDPSTAVDLDDALSCETLPNGNYQVGVHISDVTHYLKAFSELDERVAKRATSVYLVNTVYHMLPKALCQLCSLLPGQEKLTFSVVWELTPEGKVLKQRFVKSCIKSCYQMAYGEAQKMIDEPTKNWTETDLPGLKGGNYTANEICQRVNNLFALSARMRKKRFASGALSINQPKLQIILDRWTGIPISCQFEYRRESNYLVEEFMLLANMSVAKHLYEKIPDTAFLRVHREPLERILRQVAEDLAHLGIHLNVDSAGGLESSFAFYEKDCTDGPQKNLGSWSRMMVIQALCANAMPRANYTCAAKIKVEDDLRHYALNVPFYTHFTSPIRRYADCVVHRLLHSSITDTPLPDQWSSHLCAKIAANCNKKKYSAKVAQEKSNELYFMDLLARNGPTVTVGTVLKVKERSIQVILCYVGLKINLSFGKLQKVAHVSYNNQHSVSTLVVKWKESNISQVINVFSIVDVRIETDSANYSIRGELLPMVTNGIQDGA